MSPGPRKGWEGGPQLEISGSDWPLGVAAKLLEIPEKDLRDLVRITGLKPSGTIRMASYSRQGRQPRAYPADKLVLLCEAVRSLSEDLTASA